MDTVNSLNETLTRLRVATRQPSIHNMNIINKHGLQLVCVPNVKCLFVHVRKQ
jgi:hypothetical protein